MKGFAPFLLPNRLRRGVFIFQPHSYGIATLMRIGVRLPNGGKLMVHHFRPHAEHRFHDHPWSFRTLVLWGSYVDESLDQQGCVIRDVLRAGSTRRRAAAHAHRTSCPRHTWTLVLAGPKQRRWCEGEPGAWVCEGDAVDFDTTRGMHGRAVA